MTVRRSSTSHLLNIKMNFWAFNRVPVLTVAGEKNLKSFACLFDTDLEAAAMLDFSDNSLFPAKYRTLC